eukprot:CAMPEP_0178370336 /NCGR_PEP_ID=MMETSP0689_2-20121128/249_1 /TAXON_ID=160604 /ORGANISM="Amphidinium massartii, Strain CS-259" /LENGTH=560 /DNA_ID=CAMNT_0019990153 /DNA_START=8 /DNA_END=1691 /DNA_ORIENTATION=-
MTRVYSRTGMCWFLRNLVQLDGSVFPTSFLVSLPPAVIAAVLVQLHATRHFDILFDTPDVDERIFSNSAIWSGFTFLVGFLVVFRTSHGYNRFWEACASVHKMGAEWFDSCSALIAYTKVSTADQAEVIGFQNKVVRLFSLLHAVALAELEDLDNGSEQLEVRSFEMELVDAGAFDDETLQAIRDSPCRVELVYQWIQSLIVDAQARGILAVPPPILTRSFQELSGGMVCFHDALKVADTPFPFPYSQTCDMLLFFLYVTAPFVVSSYCSKWWLAFFFTFAVIFTYGCLTLTGLELEFPYGRDANDIQGIDLQLEMNLKLRLLVSKVCWRHPQLRQGKDPSLTRLQLETNMLNSVNNVNPWSSQSLSALWQELPFEGVNAVRRNFASAPRPTGSQIQEGAVVTTSTRHLSESSNSNIWMSRLTGASAARSGGHTFTELNRTQRKAARRCTKVHAHHARNRDFYATYLTTIDTDDADDDRSNTADLSVISSEVGAGFRMLEVAWRAASEGEEVTLKKCHRSASPATTLGLGNGSSGLPSPAEGLGLSRLPYPEEDMEYMTV